ncbi:hypothetical protein HOLleu_22133 [Holothuria leucospilota]|uniref:Reverse transcriptase domain-containing protein n=1 Tax=Holothuria leucospilota TaxID=206669 RepID=A0A9Q1BYM8_HOLLE|nr:hypothetical protein HOLleu_22133 [Holothuria leucospilota]
MTNLSEGIEGVQVVIDDVLIYGSTEAEHDARVKRVLEILKEQKVKLNKKCKFKPSELTYLGPILSGDGLKCDPQNVKY